MEGTPLIVEDEKGLEIETAQGLQSFLDYIAADYAILNDSGLLNAHLEAVHQELQDTISKCLRLLKNGEGVSDEAVSDMQNLYNEIVAAADELLLEEASAASTQQPEKSEEVELGESMPETVVALNDNDPAETVTEEKRDKLLKSATELVLAAKKLLAEYAEPVSQYPDTSFNPAVHLYAELKETSARVQSILELVTTLKDKDLSDIDSLVFEHYEEQLEEVEENLEQLEEGLDNLFSEDKVEVAVLTKKPSTGKLAVSLDEHGASEVTITTPPPKPKIFAEPAEPARAIQNSLLAPKLREEVVLKSPISSYVKMALRDVRYQQFIDNHFSSLDDIEISFLRRVQQVEMPSQFQMLLGEKTESAFHTFLKDMKTNDVEAFNRQKPEIKRQTLKAKNIQYEAFFDWMGIYDQMKNQVRVRPDMTFGELFVRNEIEELISVMNV